MEAPNERAGLPTAVFCIAGTSSGVGKSSMVVGIAAALRERGLTVQAFKVGPDFIDPMHHQAATGRPSINLDSWMLSREQVLAAFHRAAVGADVAVVEGVMGLFDGRDGTTEQGSTAQLAKWLGAPVVLVLDASAVARSAAATAKGYIEFDPDLHLAGLLFNKVGGPAHTQWLQDAMGAAGIKAAILGGVPKSDAVVVPERHLGLHMPGDEEIPDDLVGELAALVATHVDLDALLALGATAQVPPPTADAEQQPQAAPTAGAQQPAALNDQHPQQQQGEQEEQEEPESAVRIAVARDAAFCFYYNDNLHLLRQCGAELVFFSPLAEPLPPDVAGVYLGGGYPERHAAELAHNRLLRASLAAFARAGGVVYAECGGLLYLSKSVQPQDEPARPMVGVFPFKTVMTQNKMTMGYVEVETGAGCPLFPAGRTVRGQVYHFSEIVQESVVRGLGEALAGKQAVEVQAPAWGTCYRVQAQIPGAAEVAEGFYQQNVLASYVHLHFGNCPDFAASLVAKCRSVDVAAVSAAVHEAAQTAAYLESAITSLHSTPRAAAKSGPRGVQHCRSSPDFARDERLAGKQRVAAAADLHRGFSEDPAAASRQLAPLAENGHSHMSRRGSLQQQQLQQPGAPPRSLSPATTLSKVMSMNSLSSYSPHIGTGVLPPGEVLSPPLSDSPQLSPRELEQQGSQAMQFALQQQGSQQFGLQQQASQQLAYQQQQYAHQQPLQNGLEQHGSQHFGLQQQGSQQLGLQQQPSQPFGLQQQGSQQFGLQQHPSQQFALQQHGSQQLAYQPQHRPQQHAAMVAGTLSSNQMSTSCSWPRLHQPGPPPIMNGRQPPLTQQQAAFYAASSTTGPNGGAWPPSVNGANGNSMHSRSCSVDRPLPSGGASAVTVCARSPGSMELLAELEPRHLALSATPYNWQHSQTPSDKIVSLSPGATEMLWALGLGARVAAVSDACDFPPDVVARAKARRSFAATASWASSLDRHGSSPFASAVASRRESPTCAVALHRGGSSWQNLAHGSSGGSSGASSPTKATAASKAAAGGGGQAASQQQQQQAQQHAQQRRHQGQHQPGHQQHQVEFVVDEEVLARERPGMVVYEENDAALCASGSASAGAMMGGCGMGQAVLEALMTVGLQQSCRVVCMRRRTLSDVLESMLVVGEAAGVREEALRTVERMRSRLRRVAGAAAAAAADAPSRPRVLVLQSLRPLRTVGWWLADQITLAGGTCWSDEQAGDAPAELTWEQVQAFAPEVLVIAGMQGGSALSPLTDLCTVASQPGWWNLPAVRSAAVFVADASLLCRPGPRLVEGVECLARMLWDDAVPDCTCPERALLKLSLRPGQRCRPRLLPNHFVPAFA